LDINTFLASAICAGTGAAGGSAGCWAQAMGTYSSTIWHSAERANDLTIFKVDPRLIWMDTRVRTRFFWKMHLESLSRACS
jgi:hypothetical protein